MRDNNLYSFTASIKYISPPLNACKIKNMDLAPIPGFAV